jgi:IS4 transposase
LFFKWIKQHLRVKKFYGTSANAVKTQLWVALIVYLLVAILKKRLGLQASLYKTLQILSLTLFEKMPILRALESTAYDLLPDPPSNQLNLFDL